MRKRVSFITALAFTLGAASVALAQNRVIQGRVFDAANREPLPGAVVSVVSGVAGTQTGNGGQFRLTVPAADVQLLVRMVGYTRATVRVPAGQETVEVGLDRDILKLSEVVVSGAATTTERKTATTAVTTVGAEELTRAPGAVSLDAALQGKLMGTHININSGAPGGGAQVQIRGVTSILGNGEPLYVVDGVIVSNAAFSSGINAVTRASTAATAITTNQDNPVNRLADINPNDIENIQVLKSAAASAIYGSKATNGVVLITTKRGRSGTPRFTVTQRLGTYDAERLVGSRRFTRTTAYDVLDSATVNEICNPNCPHFDYQKDLYGRNDLSYETVGTVSGGSESTRYFVSAFNRSEAGTQLNAGARRQSLRLNLDQTFGTRWNANVSASVSRSVTNRGLSNNDNTYVSPMYAFGYTPALFDLKTPDANGNFPDNQFLSPPDGSNPFQTLAFIRNREDVWRQIVSGTVRFSAFSSGDQSVVLSLGAGYDRYDADGQVYSPNFLDYEPADALLGTTVQSEALSQQINATLSAVHTWTPQGGGFSSFLTSATTSAGLQMEERGVNRFNVQARGLVPTIDLIDQGQPTLFHNKTAVRDQAFFVGEEIVALGERLSLTGRVRGERSSVNGDRDRFFFWPAASAAYRFINPLPMTDEVKLRAAWGTSGNQANYGNRDRVIQITGVVDGRVALGVPGTVGNPDVEPEKMTELEIGTDLSFAESRVAVEFNYFDRTITNMLLSAALAPTTGFGARIVNGGELETEGVEAALTIVPIRTPDITWSLRSQFYTFDTKVVDLPSDVAPFVVASSGFGAQYGRSRIVEGVNATMIWGNLQVPRTVNGRDTVVTVDTIVGDANPDFQMQFGSDVTWKNFTLSALVDWRKGGLVSNMTQNLFDEGLNSRDYDDPSPVAGVPLGQYRYERWAAGTNSSVYIQDGSFVKLREVSLAYQVPAGLLSRLPGGTRDVRLSLSARNLHTWTDYWGADPEVNNFGNQNVTRFVDLAPYPTSRSFFFSVDLGF